MGVFHDLFLSYSHLLPNDDEAFEHFDSFISRRIDEVGLPFKLWKVYICNCARNVTMLYLLHTFPPPNSVKGSDIKRVEGLKGLESFVTHCCPTTCTIPCTDKKLKEHFSFVP